MATKTKQIAGITVPDTPLITASLELARKHLEDWAYNHIVRSWLIGFAVADRIPDFQNRDKELHSIAAILHDLGWDKNETFVSKDKIFEVDGANAARKFIEEQTAAGGAASEWDKHRKQLLWDAIALHTYPPVNMHKEVEVAATGIGIGLDFRGPDFAPGGALTWDDWNAISKEYPRTGFKSGVIKTMCGFCRNKPEATYGTFVGDFGDKLVEGYSQEGKRPYDFICGAVDAD